jgi:phosphoribosylanthranilate isomerase
MTIIKICGITTLEDALLCADLGVEMLGFNFYAKSVRLVSSAKCQSMVAELRKRGYNLMCVGVFVNAAAAEIEKNVMDCGLDAAQLHGDEDPSFAASLSVLNYKAYRGLPLPANANLYPQPAANSLPRFLVDASVAGKYGGTGASLDWAKAADLNNVGTTNQSFLLAGGITPANVAEAIEKVAPWGVDIASGVEEAIGKKSVEKVRMLVEKVRNAQV